MKKRISIANFILSKKKKSKRPLLIVGNGRSGTSWIGKTLSRAPLTVYQREPCNPFVTGIDDDSVWSRYVPEDGYDGYFHDALNAAFGGLFVRPSEWNRYALTDRLFNNNKAIVKEVATYLSIKWVYRTWNPEVLIVLRHPCPTILSVHNLDLEEAEASRFEKMKRDERLMRDYLHPFEHHLNTIQGPIEVSAAIWAIKNFVAFKAKEKSPEWHFIRYEDVCLNPLYEFRSLYNRFGLTWNREVEDWVLRTTEKNVSGAFATSRVSSEKINSWKTNLGSDDVMKIRRVIEPFELPFYNSAEDWEL